MYVPNNTDWLSVDFSDPDRKTMLAGGHESAQTLYRSSDKGATWSEIGGGLPVKTNCTMPLLINPKTYLVGCGGYGGGVTGVYRTSDGAATWSQVTASGGGSPPLLASDGTIYWVGVDGSVTRSSDSGQTWTEVAAAGTIGLWQGNITSVTPIELPGKQLAAVGKTAIVVSSDRGAHWSPVTPDLPIDRDQMVRGVVYSPVRKAFYIWHSTCSSFNNDIPIPADAIMRFDWQ